MRAICAGKDLEVAVQGVLKRCMHSSACDLVPGVQLLKDKCASAIELVRDGQLSAWIRDPDEETFQELLSKAAGIEESAAIVRQQLREADPLQRR